MVSVDVALAQYIEDNSVPIPESGCWIWLKSCNKGGYGQTGTRIPGPRGHSTAAHRASYKAHYGDPGGKCVLHRCDVPSCVNPAHLFLGTYSDNINDCVAKGRFKGVGRKPLLTKEQENELRSKYRPRCNVRKLAAEYGIQWRTVYDILKRS